MAGLTLVLGAARSGKSAYAVDVARRSGSPVLFIATGQPIDAEMALRIREHRRKRPPDWRTVDEPLAPIRRALEQAGPSETVLVDCLTTWIGNLFHAHIADPDNPRAGDVRKVQILARSELTLIDHLERCTSVLISNEVGAGIVPESALARAYRDLLGEVNQTAARYAQNVTYLIAGIPLRVKAE